MGSLPGPRLKVKAPAHTLECKPITPSRGPTSQTCPTTVPRTEGEGRLDLKPSEHAVQPIVSQLVQKPFDVRACSNDHTQCSAACQKADWPRHKHECRAADAAAAPSAANLHHARHLFVSLSTRRVRRYAVHGGWRLRVLFKSRAKRGPDPPREADDRTGKTKMGIKCSATSQVIPPLQTAAHGSCKRSTESKRWGHWGTL